MGINLEMDAKIHSILREKHPAKGNYCPDGLINDVNEAIYLSSKYRIAYILKESYQNEGDDGDCRGFNDTISATFNRNKAKDLLLVSKIFNGQKPTLEELGDYATLRSFNGSFPYCWINLKKLAGGSRTTGTEVFDHFMADKDIIRQQVEISRANILICGGKIATSKGEQWIANLLINELYPNDGFTMVNEWVYHSIPRGLFIINNFHPSYAQGEDKFLLKMKEITIFSQNNCNYEV